MIIKKSDFTSHHLTQLHQWFESMWGPFGAFEESKLGIILPSPIIAIDVEQLVGGLSFTAYQSPEKNEIGLWINALYIDSNMRGNGLGSKLIIEAENVAKEYGFKVIYANSNIPALYIKNGWLNIAQNGADTVLKKDLNYSLE